MSITETEQPAALPRIPRRWFRFSLSSLFVLVTAVAVLVVSYGSIKRWVMKDAVSPALVRIFRHRPQLLPDNAQGTSSEREFELYRKTQMALIKSDFVLQAVLRDPTIAGTPIVKQHKADAVSWLKEHLEVKSPEDTEIIQISFADGSPLERVAITNAIKNVYMEEIVNGERMERLRERQIVEKLYTKGRDDYRSKTELLRKLERQYDLDAGGIKKGMLVKKLEGVSDRRNRIQDRLFDLDLQQEIAPKDASGTASNSNSEREACERQLAKLDSLMAEYVEAIRSAGTEYAHVESLRTELEVLSDVLKKLATQLRVWAIEVDATPRIITIQDAK